MSFNRMIRCNNRLFVVALGIVCACLLAGCGGGTSPKGKVKGKVTLEGQPVTGGTVSFAPVSGSRTATGDVQPDGTFSLSTDKADDGAAIGKNAVTYTAPQATEKLDAEGQAIPGAATPSPYANLVPKTPEVEIKAGTNEITVELVAPGGAAAPTRTPGS